MTLKELGRSYLTVSKDVSKMPDSASKSGLFVQLNGCTAFSPLTDVPRRDAGREWCCVRYSPD
jgi:hypothetical protein